MYFLSNTLNDLTRYNSVKSILLSHFILDLRSIYPVTSDVTNHSHKVTSLQFAVGIENNLGTTLHLSRFTGEERFIEDEDQIIYSQNPLATGLLASEPESFGEDGENTLVK